LTDVKAEGPGGAMLGMDHSWHFAEKNCMSRLPAAWRLHACAALCAAACAASASAASAELEASALALLRGQLEQGYGCELAQVLAVREIPIGDDIGLEGRVRCTDVREYDFSRTRSGQRFDIRLCQPTVC
jgi:hypothetical protein